MATARVPLLWHSERYDTSVCTDSTMMHALYQMPALECVANIVKELVTHIGHCPCAVALACCNGTECSKNCWVNSSRIVQESTNNVVDAFDHLWGEGLCGVTLHPLNLCTILNWCCLVRIMLGRDQFGVLVLCEGFVDVTGMWQLMCPCA